jgi:hypothetical protein
MAIQTREYLKSRFETGDKPTQQDFIDFIDTFLHLTEDAGENTVLTRLPAGSVAGLAVASSRFVGRKATGDLTAMTVAEAQALLGLSGNDPGDMKMIAHSTIPAGWLLCDGSAVSRATYAALFAVIGITWGAGNTTTTFNLPDLRAKYPAGADGTHAVGAYFGTADHSHTVLPLTIAVAEGENPPVTVADDMLVNTSTVAHIPPSAAVNFIIKI